MQSFAGALVPIVAIVMGIGMGFWHVYWDHQRRRLEYDERRLMIERGMTPPPPLPDRPKRTLDDSLRRGIIMSFLGVGLAIGYVILHGPDIFAPASARTQGLAVGAAIVLLWGLGNLAYYVVARKQAQPSAGA